MPRLGVQGGRKSALWLRNKWSMATAFGNALAWKQDAQARCWGAGTFVIEVLTHSLCFSSSQMGPSWLSLC